MRKDEYPLFKHNKRIYVECFCCEYAIKAYIANNYFCDMPIYWQDVIKRCKYCPIKWAEKRCDVCGSEYEKWKNATDWQEAAHWARVIAELPERGKVTE